jgi:membrane protein implicated in regulation of membrane protease activity
MKPTNEKILSVIAILTVTSIISVIILLYIFLSELKFTTKWILAIAYFIVISVYNTFFFIAMRKRWEKSDELRLPKTPEEKIEDYFEPMY